MQYKFFDNEEEAKTEEKETTKKRGKHLKFLKFCDPAHGWIKVKKALLKELGIENKISSCSYQKGEFAYLEEDSDARKLFEALEEKGIEINIDVKNTNKSSKIRSYESYQIILKDISL